MKTPVDAYLTKLFVGCVVVTSLVIVIFCLNVIGLFAYAVLITFAIMMHSLNDFSVFGQMRLPHRQQSL